MDITISLNEKEAFAFAQFLKRTLFNDYKERSLNEDEAYEMIYAAEKIRDSFTKAGVAQR